jgi:hypothetical protein
MQTPAAPTYLLPGDETVSVGPWFDHSGAEIGERIDHWDPFTDLDWTRAVTVDLDAIRTECGLGDDSAFALLATWRAPTRTRLGGSGQAVELGTLTGVVRAAVSVSITGREAGGRLDLTTRLVLRTSGASPSVIAPRRPGAILWTDTDRVMLEGSAARFPTAAVNFAEVPRIPDAAAWYLDWNVNDLTHPVMGGLRLLVNRDNARIVNAVRSSTDDPAASLIRSIMRIDIARQLVRAAVSSDDFIAAPDSFPDESIGRLIRDLIATVWPAIPIDAVRERALTMPARFDADVQAALEVAG